MSGKICVIYEIYTLVRRKPTGSNKQRTLLLQAVSDDVICGKNLPQTTESHRVNTKIAPSLVKDNRRNKETSLVQIASCERAFGFQGFL